MKIFLIVLRIIFLLFLILNIVLWIGIYGSGHAMPKETETSILYAVILLTIAIILNSVILKRFKK